MTCVALRPIVAGDPAPGLRASLADRRLGTALRLPGHEGGPVHVGVLVRVQGAAARLAAI